VRELHENSQSAVNRLIQTGLSKQYWTMCRVKGSLNNCCKCGWIPAHSVLERFVYYWLHRQLWN